MRSPLNWLTEPSGHRGVEFADDPDGWSFISYRELANSVLIVTEQVRDRSVPDEVVCLALPTGRDFLAAFFGVWAAGATVCPLPPQGVGQSAEAYITALGAILAEATPAVVLTSADVSGVLRAAVDRAGLPGRIVTTVARDGPPASEIVEASGDVLLQFTSGSTGKPRGVRVSAANLRANIAMIRSWLAWTPEDSLASWLPLHHDMGLIGCMVTPVVSQANLWLMRPDQFVRSPARWLECFGRQGATITASPPFGYGYTARRTTSDELSGLDFTGWRVAIVGAEPIDPSALHRFTTLVEERGFNSSALRPAYGMAEATLAVTGSVPGQPPLLIRTDPSRLRFGAPVVVTDRCELTAVEGPGWLVGSGVPLEGTTVEIHESAAGPPLPDGHLGEIVVEGPTVGMGYRGGDPVRSTRFDGRRLWTGDAGFLHEGQLFVIGRIGDSLKNRGRSVYVEDLEAAAAAELGIGRGRLAAISTSLDGRPGVALLAERSSGQWVDEAARLLRRMLGDGLRITIIGGDRGLIRRGTSGKPRRRHMWEELQGGRLGGTVLLDDPGGDSQ